MRNLMVYIVLLIACAVMLAYSIANDMYWFALYWGILLALGIRAMASIINSYREHK